MPYHLLSDKAFPERVRFFSWCPTMDLLITLSTLGDLALYRFIITWQKVWSLPPPKDTTVGAVAWRPDGKVLAIGYSTGVVKLYDVNTAEVVHTILGTSGSENPAPVTCLHWAEESVKKRTMHHLESALRRFEMTQYMPQLSVIPNATSGAGVFASTQREGTANRAIVQDEAGGSMNLLVAGDSEGNFHLSVFGIFYLGVVSLSKITKLPLRHPNIVRASVTPDLSAINLVIHEANSSQQRMLMLDTNLLHTRKSEIRSLSLKSTQVNFLINYIAEGVRATEEDYDRVVELTKKNLEVFERVLLDHNGGLFVGIYLDGARISVIVDEDEGDRDVKTSTTPTIEFLGILATGTPSEPLQQYLQRELTERGLKKWERQAESGYLNMRKLVHEYIQPACERLIVHLSDINGYSRWYERFGPVGLEEPFVHSCIMLAGSFVGRLQELLKMLNVELRNFKEFAKWLHVIRAALLALMRHPSHATVVESVQPTEQIPSDRPYVAIDTIRVAEFLQTSFTSDRLASFFVRQPDESLEPFLPPCEFPLRPGGDLDTSSAQTSIPPPRNLRSQPEPARQLRRPAYPYTFVFPSELPSNMTRPTLRGFSDRLGDMCGRVFDTSANLIGQSLRMLGSVELTKSGEEEIHNGVEGEGGNEHEQRRGLLTQMRIVEKDAAVYQYVAYVRPRGLQGVDATPPSLWVARFRHLPPSTISITTPVHWHVEVACVLLKSISAEDDEGAQGSGSLDLLDMEFYDDEILCVVLREVGDDGNEKRHLASFAYTEADYRSMTSENTFGRGVDMGESVDFSMVDHAMKHLLVSDQPGFIAARSRVLTQFEAVTLATNGREGRRIVGLLARDRKRMLVLDTETEEDDQEDETENGEVEKRDDESRQSKEKGDEDGKGGQEDLDDVLMTE
ncbi:hypothetical protein BC938DRAFT_473640 [Jimgerdemannia flammicorona]|uniref:Anaphase-promoting complex subunit 4 n=1 Tax=Jimgerdemannia flammicorona TaxID=994334 RepID=A0A433QT64_9FUNG|nr:hypothetical protein BC938DRAFT_473640 [Jimgerdemannia flammicorona]